MKPALGFLDRQRDFGLLVLRVVVGATYLLFGFTKLIEGPDYWKQVGSAVHHFGLFEGHLYWGLAATLAEVLGGAALVAGLWVRPAALALCVVMVVATVARFEAFELARPETYSRFTYPLSMAAVLLGLVFLGGGRFGVEGGGRASTIPPKAG